MKKIDKFIDVSSRYLCYIGCGVLCVMLLSVVVNVVGRRLFNFTIGEVPELLEAYMAQTNTAITDYDDLVLHQANMMILKTISKKVGMPMEKVPVCLDRYGNTSGCSVPLAIVDKYGESKEDREVNLLTSSFGVGLSWGVVGFRINIRDVLPITVGMDTYDDGYSDDYADDGVLRKTE